MDKKRIVLDTNIIISAFGWNGEPKKLLDKIIENEFEWIISQNQIEELSRVLNYNKFKFSDEQKERIKTIVLSISILVEPKEKLNIINEDKDDNKILECAIEGKVGYIITGDSHLLKLKEFRDIKILKISEFF